MFMQLISKFHATTYNSEGFQVVRYIYTQLKKFHKLYSKVSLSALSKELLKKTLVHVPTLPQWG
jgi:hypothetical protein